MFVNENTATKGSASTSDGLDRTLVRPSTKRSQLSINIIQQITLINVCQ